MAYPDAPVAPGKKTDAPAKTPAQTPTLADEIFSRPLPAKEPQKVPAEPPPPGPGPEKAKPVVVGPKLQPVPLRPEPDKPKTSPAGPTQQPGQLFDLKRLEGNKTGDSRFRLTTPSTAKPLTDAGRANPPEAAKKTPIDAPKNPYQPLTRRDYEAQQRSGSIEAKNDRPGATPPKYPGVPHDQDKIVLTKILRPSPLASSLYKMYLETYTDRSEENKLPENIGIAELHKGMKDKVKSIELLSDSEMFLPDQHNLILHPTGRKSPGHFFAVLRDENQIPVNLIEYHTVEGKPKYLQQWVFDREAIPDTGGKKTTISHFRETSATAMGRPPGENGVMADVFMGRTDYITDNTGNIITAAQYNNLNKPIVQIEYGDGAPKMYMRDANSGKMAPSAFSRAYMSRMAFSSVYLR
jgi:hypothetical protein